MAGAAAAVVAVVVAASALRGGDDDPPATTAGTAASTTSSDATLRSVSVEVPGASGWVDTGLDASPGDRIAISARGTIQHAAPDPATEVGPGGDPEPALEVFNFVHEGAPVPGRHGALLARIGDGAPVVVGADGVLEATAPGRVYLVVNDVGVQNNAGAFDVTVTLTPG